MENQQQRVDNGPEMSFIPKTYQLFWSGKRALVSNYEKYGPGGHGLDRRLVLSLGILNIILLIIAIVIGANCAGVKSGSLHVSDSAVAKVINELSYLRSNHSDVMEAETEAKSALDNALKNHKQLKVQIAEKKSANDNYQKQVEALLEQKLTLQANLSAAEDSCLICPYGWIAYNSSCYFFSFTESRVKKNWPDSRADCTGRNSDMIVVDNKEEQTFVSATIESMSASSQGDAFWLGLSDTATEGQWVWVNNVVETENRYWMEGEPNDHGQRGEDCAVTVFRPTFPWRTRNDLNCEGQKKLWICEMAARRTA